MSGVSSSSKLSTSKLSSSRKLERSAEIEEGEQKVLHGEKEAEESKKELSEVK